MPSPICTTSSTIQCTHGGQALLTTSNTDLQIAGSFALLETDVHSVAGCPFVIGTTPSPCLTIRWTLGATQTNVRGTKVLLQSSIGTCYNAAQAPQGVAIIVQVQPLAQGI